MAVLATVQQGVVWPDLTPLALDIMLLGGILLVFFADLFLDTSSWKRGLGWLSAGVLALVFVASFFIDTNGVTFWGSYEGGGWATFLKRVFWGAGILAVLGSSDYVAEHFSHRQGEYYLLILFSVLGMSLLPGARDLILLMVCFELMGLPLFVLAAYAKGEGKVGRFSSESALKLYLVGAASTAITLFGLSLIFGLVGSTRLADLTEAPASPLLFVGMALTFSGMGFKIGAVPFHMWVPDTYEGAPAPFVAFLAVAPKFAGFAALVGVFILGLSAHQAAWVPVASVICFVSMLVGNLLAINQSSVKRLLAYSGVAHIGYMLMAFAAGDALGLTMLLFYAAGYVVTNMGAFLVVHLMERATGTDSIDSYAGLASRSPRLALAMLLFLLSLGGIPFVVGFWAKLYVFVAAWRAGLGWLVLTGAVLAVVALFYYLRIARAMYMDPAPNDAPEVRSTPRVQTAIALCLAGVVLMGVFPGPLVAAAERAAQTLLHDTTSSAMTPVLTLKDR